MKFLFDLGGVFFDWNPKYFYNKIFDDPQKMNFFLSEVCNDSWNSQHDAGKNIKQGEEELIFKFPEFEDKIKMYYSNHKKMIKGVFSESIEILEKLKKLNYSCYVLSNWSAETFESIKELYPFLYKFDGIMISGEEKLLKPDPSIYKLAINKFNLEPLNCVFIDDKLINIQAAQKLSFQTIYLKNPQTIKIEIEKFLIK